MLRAAVFTVAIAVIFAVASVLSHDVIDNVELEGFSAQELLRGPHFGLRQAAVHRQRNVIRDTAARFQQFQKQQQQQKRVGNFSLSCPDCEKLIGTVLPIISNKTEDKKIASLLEGVICTSMKKDDVAVCKDIVNLLVNDILPDIVKAGKSLAWDFPQVICSDIIKACTSPCCESPTLPEQVWLSFADNEDYTSSMRVTWTTMTFDYDTPQTAKFGPAGSSPSTWRDAYAALPRTYTVGNWVGYIHSTVMDNLMPNTSYTYTVGSAHGRSQQFTFKTLSEKAGSAAVPLRVLQIADMGYGPNSNNTIKQITAMAQADEIDVIWHFGDISYADLDFPHWDVFGRKIQGYSAIKPIVYQSGNHELYYNFTAYKYRLGRSMPLPNHGIDRDADAMFFHQRIGTVQLLSLNSETWYDTPNFGTMQVDWAKAVVKSHPKSSDLPWLIAAHHRSMYCTGSPKIQCGAFSEIMRLQVESFYDESKVDMCIAGHLHHYERTWPVVAGFPTQKNYKSPKAPVYFTNGAAGNREGNGKPKLDKDWSAAGSSDIGFAVLTFRTSGTQHTLNSTFYRSSDRSVVDTFVIEKDL